MPRIGKALHEKIREAAKNRCGYCLSPQELLPYRLEIEHIYPRGLGGETIEENLWLACRECNSHKARKVKVVDDLTGKSVRIFDPRNQIWTDHFAFGRDGNEIIGKTACGRGTVASLQMNNIFQRTARSAWVTAKRFPPED